MKVSKGESQPYIAADIRLLNSLYGVLIMTDGRLRGNSAREALCAAGQEPSRASTDALVWAQLVAGAAAKESPREVKLRSSKDRLCVSLFLLRVFALGVIVKMRKTLRPPFLWLPLF